MDAKSGLPVQTFDLVALVALIVASVVMIGAVMFGSTPLFWVAMAPIVIGVRFAYGAILARHVSGRG